MNFDVSNLENYSLYMLRRSTTLSDIAFIRNAVWKHGTIFTVNASDVLPLMESAVHYRELSDAMRYASDKMQLAVQPILLRRLGGLDTSGEPSSVHPNLISLATETAVAIRIPTFNNKDYAGPTIEIDVPENFPLNVFSKKEYIGSVEASQLIDKESSNPDDFFPKLAPLPQVSGRGLNRLIFNWSARPRAFTDVVDFIKYCKETKEDSFKKWGWEKFSYEYKMFYSNNGARVNGLLEDVDYSIVETDEEHCLVKLLTMPAFKQETFLQTHCIGKSTRYYDKAATGEYHYFSLRTKTFSGDPLATVEVGVTPLPKLRYSINIVQIKGYDNDDVPTETVEKVEHLLKAWATSKWGKDNAKVVPYQSTGRMFEIRMTDLVSHNLHSYQAEAMQRIARGNRQRNIPVHVVDYLDDRGLNNTDIARSSRHREMLESFLLNTRANALGVPIDFLQTNDVGIDVTFNYSAWGSPNVQNLQRRLMEDAGFPIQNSSIGGNRERLYQGGRRAGKSEMFAALYGMSKYVWQDTQKPSLVDINEAKKSTLYASMYDKGLVDKVDAPASALRQALNTRDISMGARLSGTIGTIEGFSVIESKPAVKDVEKNFTKFIKHNERRK